MSPVLWQMVDHHFTKAHASQYLDGELGRSGSERVERHTAVCPQCRALIASLRRVIDELPGLAASPRSRLAERVLERLGTGA